MIEEHDPTWIDIELDPTVQRMRGVAAHGHTPFDVSFISHVKGNLWQGGCESGLILPDHIKMVYSLYPWEQYFLHDTAHREEIAMYDSVDQGFDQVDEIAHRVAASCEVEATLVHCQAGLNRSGLIAARVLMLQGMTAHDAIALLREKRSPAVLCNPAFERYLRSLDGPSSRV